MSEPTSYREIEFKFRIPAQTDLDLRALLASVGVDIVDHDPRSMVAIYYDTANLSLLRWGITLRNRHGGGDDGWHMKVPAEPSGNDSARDEIRIQGSDSVIPVELASLVTPLTRRQELQPMATVRTRRQPFVIRAANGTELIEVVDDFVDVGSSSLAEPTSSFHEVEVELLIDSADSRQTAALISDALVDAGAQVSSLSKAASALGPAAADPPDVPALKFPKPSAPAVDALQAVFSTYVRDLLMADVGVRRMLPDSVHQMRVACRRLRSALKTFDSLLDHDSVDYLRGELKWMASELGEVRDTEVQLTRLGSLATDERVKNFIEESLEARLRAATSSALAALRSDRHDFLIEDLILLVSEPPVTVAAFDSAAERLPACVATPWHRLDKAVGKATLDGPAERWHRVRIRAKQARYAAEAVAPILGGEFARLGKDLATVTDTLGNRQDAHVASIVLRELADQAPGPIAYELGLIAAHNAVAGNQDIRTFLRRWPDIVRRAKEAGLD